VIRWHIYAGSFQHSRLYRWCSRCWVKFNGYCGKVSKIEEELLSKEPSFIIIEEKILITVVFLYWISKALFCNSDRIRIIG